MAYTYNEDGTSSSTFNKNRGHGEFKKPTINTAVGGLIHGAGAAASVAGIAYLGLKAINSANEE